MKTYYRILVLCTCALLLSCSKQSSSHPSENEVKRLLVPGTSRVEVEKAFGYPIYTNLIHDGGVSVVYHWDPRGTDNFSGFHVLYKNDHVVKISPVYSYLSTFSTNEKQNSSTQQAADAFIKGEDSGKPASSVSFYVVSETRREGWTYVGPPILMDSGYIAPVPDYTVTNVASVDKGVFLTTIGNVTKENPAITLHLTPASISSFYNFTQKGSGNMVIFAVDSRPVKASFLADPIEHGEFFIAFDNQEQRDDIYLRLTAIVRKGN